ncbi:flavin-binding monooxygenase-like-domain-containing protein [Hyaloraphidium curvatum]|nr:flavin-binding monooxygenase-like-domain-containing protein [Hyaloraphidium curvatum]
MAYSDHPPPGNLAYTSKEEYVEYLDSYADKFGLKEHIQYGTEVADAARRADGGWVISLSTPDGPATFDADALVVCTGANQVPKVPDFGFGGDVFHSTQFSAELKQRITREKMRVLVVGAGESAADIATDAQEAGGDCTLWTRRVPLVGPRFLTPGMTEADGLRLQQAGKGLPINAFLETMTTSRLHNDLSAMLYSLPRHFIWRVLMRGELLADWCLEHCKDTPWQADQSGYATKNARFVERVAAGKIKHRISKSIKCDGKSVTFDDGTAVEFDAIIACTGFGARMPFLEKSCPELVVNPRRWYRHCFPPLDHPAEKEGPGHLFFVGYARPHQGGIPQLAELLSRQIAGLLSGDLSLPPDWRSRIAPEAADERAHYSVSPHLDSLVDYVAFADAVARDVGCSPRLPSPILWAGRLSAALFAAGIVVRLRRRPSRALFLASLAAFAAQLVMYRGLLVKYLCYPLWPAWYRQRGPGADPAAFRAVMERFPVFGSLLPDPVMILCALLLPVQGVINLLAFPFVGKGIAGGWLWNRPKRFLLHGMEFKSGDLFDY